MEKLTVKFNFDKLRGTLSNEHDESESKESERKSKAKTGAERSSRFWKKWKSCDHVRVKNIKKCSDYRHKMKQKRQQNTKYNESIKKKECERKAEYRRKLKEIKAKLNMDHTIENTNKRYRVVQLKQKVKVLQQSKRRRTETTLKETDTQIDKQLSPQATRKSAQRVNKSLPNSPRKWASTVAHIVRNASPRKQKYLDSLPNDKKQRNVKQRQNWLSKVEEFMNSDRMSRKMPNKRDVIQVNGEHIAKRHLLLTKREAFMKFVEENPSYPFRYTTFRKSIPRYIKKMNLKDRRVCVCMKCFNLEEKLRPFNQVATKCKVEPLTLRSLYKGSVCEYNEEFPNPKCIDNSCSKCNDKLHKKYEHFMQENGTTQVKYVQWEQVSQKYTNPKGEIIVKKVWLQVDHSETLSSIFDGICTDTQYFKGHMFRNDYQYTQHQRLAKNLPEDHAIVYADFSQNYAMEANDEIQTAHYVKRQVSLHTMYLVRHAKSSTKDKPQLTKEAIAIISDDLKHSASAVYVYTMKLLSYMRNNPEKVGLPKVLHRITDNCGFEYKCKQAFAHLFDYENVMGVTVLYHYSEPGHGKGPHDGIGATIKHGLDMLVVQDRVRLRNSYEVYLAATKYLSTVGKNAEPSTQGKTEFSSRTVLYVPAKVSRNAPNENVKAVAGTMKLRFLRNISSNNVEIANLSCSCPFCLLGTGDQCEYGKWRKTAVHKIRTEPTKHTEHANTSKRAERDAGGLKETEVVSSCGDGLTEQQHISAFALHEFEADQTESRRSFKPEDFVAVYLSSNRKKKHFYVAKVIEIDDAEVKLRFLTETGSAKNIYTWPNSNDVSWVPTDEVGRVLTQPELAAGRGIRMKFKDSEMALCRKYVYPKSAK